MRTYEYEDFEEGIEQFMPELVRTAEHWSREYKVDVGDFLGEAFLKIMEDLKKRNVWAKGTDVPLPRWKTIIQREAANIQRAAASADRLRKRLEQQLSGELPRSQRWTVDIDDVRSAFEQLCEMCRMLLTLSVVDEMNGPEIVRGIPLSGGLLSRFVAGEKTDKSKADVITREIRKCRETLKKFLENDQ